MTNEHKNPPQADAALISDAQLKAALNAYNDFPCPANGSVGRFCDEGQMRAAIVAAIAAGGAQEAVQALLSKVPVPPNAITFDKGWELLDELQRVALLAAPNGEKK